MIVVTGAAGFAGSHLIDLLAGSGVDVVGWHRPGGRTPRHLPRTTWEGVDMLDFDGVCRAVERARPAAVYHCAGASHVGRAWDATERTLATNVRGTHHLLRAIHRHTPETAVFIPSSAMIYASSNEQLTEEHPLVPPNPYGLSKLAQELLGRRAATDGLRVTIGRAFNHVGPRQDPSFAASGFARQIVEAEMGTREPEVVVGNLDARRDTIDVRDTVVAYRTILERGQPGRPYNVCSGQAIAIGEMLDLLRARALVPIRVRVDSELMRPQDSPTVVGSCQRLQREMGWSPTIPLSQTLDDLLQYWRSTLRAGQ